MTTQQTGSSKTATPLYEVVCVDDRGRPNEIPEAQWPVEGQIYIVTRCRHNPLSGQWMFVLAGLTPPPEYGGYLASRFRVINELNAPKDETN